MKTSNLLLFTILSALLIMSSCSIEKRQYMSGYHVQWNKTGDVNGHLKNQELVSVVEEEVLALPLTENVDYIESASIAADEIFVPEKDKPFFVKKSRNSVSAVSSEGECDILVLKNGEEIKVKVLEILPTEIKYKKCDNLTGPTTTIYKSDVSMIKYPNGSQDIISSVNVQKNNNEGSPAPENTGKSMNVLALLSLITGILGLVPVFGILFSIGAVIMSAIALSQINKNPGKYKGKGMAITGLILGSLGILVSMGTFIVLLFF
ncbi:MAG: DUF4190 domain-containing protein [Bacteroidota bacterium]